MNDNGELWRFEAQCAGAEKVYLVRESDNGASAWIEMQPLGRGLWEVEHRLPAGHYRFRYFRAEGTTFLNCGNHGLTGERITDGSGQVFVESLPHYALPA